MSNDVRDSRIPKKEPRGKRNQLTPRSNPQQRLQTLVEEGSWVALDTETTGLSVYQGDRPYYISTWIEGEWGVDTAHGFSPTSDNACRCWDHPVTPKNRNIKWPLSKKQDIANSLKGRCLVLFNANFDLRMLASIGIYIECPNLSFSTLTPNPSDNDTNLLPEDAILVRVEYVADVSNWKHIMDNRGPRGLKDAANYYIKEDDEDETRLYEAVSGMRQYLVNRGWAKGKAVEADYWMLHQLHKGTSKVKIKGTKAQRRDYERRVSKIRSTSTLPGFSALDEYAALDAKRTINLAAYVLGQFEQGGIHADEYYALAARADAVFCVTYWMQSCGLTLRNKTANERRVELEGYCQDHRHQLQNLAGRKDFNPASPTQLASVLFDPSPRGFGLPVLSRTKSGVPSTAQGILEELHDKHTSTLTLPKAHLFLSEIVSLRKVEKMLKTLSDYLERSQPDYRDIPLPNPARNEANRRNRLYGTYNQNGTDLTRFSSRDPNLQNIPVKDGRSLRDVFGPSQGRVWAFIDGSQIELRLFALACGDEEMLTVLREGRDFHSEVAAAIYECSPEEVTKDQRRQAKGINFGLIYGAGEAKINATAGRDDAFQLFANKFPSAAEYMKRCINQVYKHGWVRTPQGDVIYVAPEPPYKAVNCVVQGAAGSIIKDCMVALNTPSMNPTTGQITKPVDWKNVFMFCNIHDELGFEINSTRLEDTTGETYEERFGWIARIMELEGEKLGCTIPMDIEVTTRRWGTKEDGSHHTITNPIAPLSLAL